MNIPVPKFISDAIDGFSVRQVFAWLKQVIIFFVRPLSFFKQYYNQGIALQIDQLIFYIVFFGVYYLLLFDGTEWVDVYKSLINFIFLSLPFVVVNSLSLLILLRKQFNLWLIISYSLLLWLLFSVPCLTLFKFFIDTENYTFYLLSNFLFMTLLLYQLLFIWNVVTASFKKMLLGYLLNILLFNVVFTLPAFIFIDAYSNDESSMDPIIMEFNSYSKNISTFKGRPFSFENTTLLNQSSSRLSFVDNDSLFTYHESYIPVFRQMATSNVKYIDSILPGVKFKRNQEALKELKEYFRLFNSYFDYPPCDTCLIEQQVFRVKKTNIPIGERKEYQFEYPYLSNLDRFNSIKDEIERLSLIQN